MKGYRVIKIVAFAAVCPVMVGLAWGWFGVHPCAYRGRQEIRQAAGE